jgi:serine/threonine protein kinase
MRGHRTALRESWWSPMLELRERQVVPEPEEMREPDPFPPGLEVAPGYRILGHLARGNRLDVYDGWSEDRVARVVLKMLRPDREREARPRRELLREGRLLAGLSHPHIVRAYETIDGERPILVLETLSGQTLDRLLEEGGPLSPVEAAHLGLQLGSAIRYLHRRRILHLDLKPSNVVAESGRAKLIDLSVAGPPGGISAGTGTWAYMAPEQARGGSVGRGADVWGLGAVLFEAVTGEPMYADDEVEEYPQLVRPIPRVEGRRDGLGATASLIDDTLQPDAAARPSVDEVLARLEGIAGLSGSERLFSDA